MLFRSDQNGNVKRLGEEEVVFEISGEGSMIAGNESWANPRKIEWGTAPCLIQSTVNAGKITVKAHTLYEGENTALPASLTFESVPSSQLMLFTEIGSTQTSSKMKNSGSSSDEVDLLNNKIRQLQYELNQIKIKAVEDQQTKFENKNQ